MAIKEYISDEENDHSKYLRLGENLPAGWKTAVDSIATDEHKHHEMLEKLYKNECQF